MERNISRCYVLLYICVLFFFLNSSLSIVEANSPSFNSPLENKLPFSNKNFRSLKGKGLEMLPNGNDEISNNAIGEPTCEELRAMWRYDNRKHRGAEHTNRISTLPNTLRWELPPPPDSPLSFGMVRPRLGHSFRPLKGGRKQQDKVFGRVLLKPGEKSGAGERKKPLDEIAKLLGKQKPSKPNKGNKTMTESEPIIHLMSPAEPTPETSFQKLKNLYRQERMKDNNGQTINANNNLKPSSTHPTPPTAFLGGKEFGKLVFAPKGHDGRAANKPKELMSPFERFRFGQVDDLLGIRDDIEGKYALTSFPVKRRNGFISFPMLKASSHRKSAGWLPPSNSASDGGGMGYELFSPEEGKFVDLSTTSMQMSNPQLLSPASSHQNLDHSIIITPSSNAAKLVVSKDDGVDDSDESYFLSPNTHITSNNGERLLMTGSSSDLGHFGSFGELETQHIPHDSFLERQPQMVEILSCPEVEHMTCSSNADCECVGYGLYRCFHGQCQVLSVTPQDLDDDYDVNGGFGVFGVDTNAEAGGGGGGGGGGMWHSNPIPSSHLGIWDSSPFVESILTMDEMKKKRKRSTLDETKLMTSSN